VTPAGKDHRLGAVFEAIADPTRRELLRRLVDAEPQTPSDLAQGLPMTRQAVSKHLLALAEAGLIRAEEVGRERRYHLTPEPLGDAISSLIEMGATWDARLRTLRSRLRDERPS
jgi:DNA-binding transcriptional ArsR family regulator